jgi:hypothetical protein
MATLMVPIGVVVKWWSKENPGVVVGMFWKVGEDEEAKFLCDDCSIGELKTMEPPLTKIDEGWIPIRKELYERGYNVATSYHPKTSISCERCGLTIPVNLDRA